MESKETFTKARMYGRDKTESNFFLERKFDNTAQIIGLIILILITHNFFPSLTIPLCIVWTGSNISSKLIAIYYINKTIGNIQISYLEEIKEALRESENQSEIDA